MVKRIKAQHHRHGRQWLLGTVSALSLLATAHAKADQVTVKDGDTVWDLANQYQTSVKAIEDANPHVKKISSSVDLIYAGQKLQLSKNDSASQPAQTTGSDSYTVKSGDTLSAISERLHVSIADLVSWNHLSNPDQLTVGQQLVVTGTSTVSQIASSVADVSSTPASAASAVSAEPVSQAQPSSAAGLAESTTIQADSASVQAAESPQSDSASASAQAVSASAVDQSSVAVSNSATDASSTEQSASSAVETAGVDSAVSLAENEDIASAQPTDSSAASVESSSDVQSAASAVSGESSSNNTQSSSIAASNPANDAAAQDTTATTAVVNNDASSTDQVGSTSTETSPVTADQTMTAESTTAMTDQTTSAASASTSDQSTQSTANSTAMVENTSTTTTSSSDLTTGSVVSVAVKLANANIPYVWGGASLSGMDCSGLVDYVFQNAEGISLPHYTVSLESCVSQHSVAEAQPGDILFWGEHGSTYHCAIYIGNNQYVAAPRPGQNVEIETISSYFMPSFAGTVNR